VRHPLDVAPRGHPDFRPLGDDLGKHLGEAVFASGVDPAGLASARSPTAGLLDAPLPVVGPGDDLEDRHPRTGITDLHDADFDAEEVRAGVGALVDPAWLGLAGTR